MILHMNISHEEVLPSTNFWSAALVAGLNASVSMGFAIATIAKESTSTAWYAGDRAAALLVALTVVAARRDRNGLLVVGSTLAGIQAADAFVRGLTTRDARDAVGPAALAGATSVSLLRLSRKPNPGSARERVRSRFARR
jgi:hypothetical protein